MFRALTGACLCLGALLVMVGNPAAANDDPARRVSVTGNASVAVTPDLARLSLGVEARKSDLGEARDEVSRVAAAFLSLCKRLGIPENKIQTTGLNIRPEYRWDSKTREQRFEGYYVQRQLQVELNDLDLLGQLIEGAVDAGVNQVSPPSLDSSRRDELHREALAAAARDARANAQVLAKALDTQVAGVHSIEAFDAGPVARPMMMEARAVAQDAAATYQAADIRIDARVNAVFALAGD